jgi:hypothetical protein
MSEAGGHPKNRIFKTPVKPIQTPTETAHHRAAREAPNSNHTSIAAASGSNTAASPKSVKASSQILKLRSRHKKRLNASHWRPMAIRRCRFGDRI